MKKHWPVYFFGGRISRSFVESIADSALRVISKLESEA